MQDLLLKDGVRYYQHTHEKEEELELLVKKYQKEIFGEDAILFDIRKKIQSATGIGTIPDAYLFKRDTEEFYLVEIELSSHPEYRHITEQVGKFLNALNNWKTRQKIASILKDYIASDIVLEKFIMDKIGTRDIYQYFLENVLDKIKEQTSRVIIVIDKITPKIEDACGILGPKPIILEFKSYARKDAESVHIYQFTPFDKTLPPPSKTKITTEGLAEGLIEVERTVHKKTYRAHFDPNKKKIIMDNKEYSPSGAAKKIANYPVDGWNFWKFRSQNGSLLLIREHRKKSSKITMRKEFKGLKQITAGKLEHKGDGIFVLTGDPKVGIDANKTTKEVIEDLKSQGYTVKCASSFYNQIRKKAGII